MADKHLTVSELIEALKAFPANSLVLIPGYEDDWDGVNCIFAGCTKLVKDQRWYYGEYTSINGEDNSVFFSNTRGD
jgi:hypothetical protein